MSDVKKLIEKILSDARFRNSSSFQNAVYKDEPIIQPASHMKSYVPEKIREMKRLASAPDAYYRTEEYIFYHQAKFMEDYEDDYEFSGEFINYYPTYQKMRSDQLRGYFSWRSRVRRGEIEKTSLSFVYVYIYELIHLIGSETETEGFCRFNDFCEEYSKLEPGIMRYAKPWLIDFAVYYDIDRSLIEHLADTDLYSYMHVLQECEACSDGELFEAICAVSSYNLKNSKLFKAYQDDVQKAVCAVYRQLCTYYVKNRKKTLFEKLFGAITEVYHKMFPAAVFYDHKKHSDHTYVINDSYKFRCSGGKWYCEKYYAGRKNQWLGDVLRTVDSIMRDKLRFGSPINSPCDTKWVLSIVNKEIDELIKYNKKKEAAKIEIDISKLAGIRRSADVTRDRLMTEEEREDDLRLQEPRPAVDAATEEPLKNDTPLTDEEYSFMRNMLYGESFNGTAMPSVLADSINEKLFDMFGDVVIFFDNDAPEIIEDYYDELKGLIKE